MINLVHPDLQNSFLVTPPPSASLQKTLQKSLNVLKMEQKRAELLRNHINVLQHWENTYQNKINALLHEKTQRLLELERQFFDNLNNINDESFPNKGQSVPVSGNSSNTNNTIPSHLATASNLILSNTNTNTTKSTNTNTSLPSISSIPSIPSITKINTNNTHNHNNNNHNNNNNNNHNNLNIPSIPDLPPIAFILQEAMNSMNNISANNNTNNNPFTLTNSTLINTNNNLYHSNNSNYSTNSNSSRIKPEIKFDLNTLSALLLNEPASTNSTHSMNTTSSSVIKPDLKPKFDIKPPLPPPPGVKKEEDNKKDIVSWPCTHCSAEYRTSNELIDHLTMHSIGNQGNNDVNGYACTECGKILKSKNNLKRHMRTHTGLCIVYCIDIVGLHNLSISSYNIHTMCIYK